jgi:LPS O-antigen subunit length determinant protein (WzzB/FepE family)
MQFILLKYFLSNFNKDGNVVQFIEKNKKNISIETFHSDKLRLSLINLISTHKNGQRFENIYFLFFKATAISILKKLVLSKIQKVNQHFSFFPFASFLSS